MSRQQSTRRRPLRVTSTLRSCFALCATLLSACGAEPGRVVIVGLDGATLRVIEPLIAQGRLPHLASLARDGASGPLRSALPLMSPRVWNSIATGKTPEEHGILGFAQQEANGKRLYTSYDRRTYALWNIASASGRSVAVVNWWNTYPPELVEGVMVSDHLLEHQVRTRQIQFQAGNASSGPLVYPEAWHDRALKLFAEREPVVDFSNPFERNKLLAPGINTETLSTNFREDGGFTRISLALQRELRPALSMVLLTGIDRASHVLWGNIEPAERDKRRNKPTPSQRHAGAVALHDYYEYSDHLLGAILAETGARDLVIVLSDHGFEAGAPTARLPGDHSSEAAADGILFVRGPGVAAGSSTQGTSIHDIVPTVLAWWGLPVAKDMSGSVAKFLEHAPIARINTYDTAPVERLGRAPSGSDDELLERLRALGYLDDAAPNAEEH